MFLGALLFEAPLIEATVSGATVSGAAVSQATKRSLSIAAWVIVPSALVACSAQDAAIPATVEGPRSVQLETSSPIPRSTPPSWFGVVVAPSSVDVAASTVGLLEAVSIGPGDVVAVGQLLAKVDSRRLQQDQLRGEAALAAAEAELRRAESVAAQALTRHSRRTSMADAFSGEEVASAALAAEVAVAEEEAATARVAERQADLERLRQEVSASEIRAPFDGVVALRFLDPGASVATGSPVVRLVSSRDRRVRFAVPPAQVEELAVGSRVLVAVEGAHVPARVVQIAPEIDAAADMVFVDAEFTNEGLSKSVRAGLAVRVRQTTSG